MSREFGYFKAKRFFLFVVGEVGGYGVSTSIVDFYFSWVRGDRLWVWLLCRVCLCVSDGV